jgi:hypothetical protein
MPWWKTLLSNPGCFLLGASLGMTALNAYIDARVRQSPSDGPGIGTLGIMLALPVLVVGGALGLFAAALLRRYGLAHVVPYVGAVGWMIFLVGLWKLI